MASLGGHWRDSAGNQVIGTAWAGYDFATEINNDSGSSLTKPNDSTIQVAEAMPVAGGKARLFIANLKIDTSHNNRGNFQARFVLTGGTGTLFTTYATGYVRNTSNRLAWIRVIGILADSSANAQVQCQIRRSSQSITRATLANVCDLQCQELYYDAIGIYTDTGDNAAYGGTTRNTVTLNSTLLESDTAKIERTGNDVALKQNETQYLLFGDVAGDTGGSRTQRIANFAYDGVAKTDTQSYAYQRNSANPYAGMMLADVYDTDEVTVNATMQCFRGLGVAADQGGADVDGNWDHLPNSSNMCVMSLHNTAELIRTSDQTGLQTLSGIATVNLNAMRTVDFSHGTSYTKNSDINMGTNTAHKMFCWSNIFTARNNVGSGSRATIGARILIDASGQTTGEHGNYTRGNQGTQDTFGGSFHPGGFYDATASGAVVVQSFDAGDNGGTDRTQPNTVSFFAINMDSLENSSGTAYTIDAEAGAYAVAGVDATLIKGIQLDAEAGAYLYTGQDADLSVVNNYAIAAEQGSYATAGVDAALILAATISADTGVYNLTGQDANFRIGRILIAESGIYGITGQDATLSIARTLIAEGGSYLVTGSDVALNKAVNISAEGGSYSVTGQDADLIGGSVLIADAGSYILSGQDVDLRVSTRLQADAGSYVLDGSDATLTVNTGNFLIAEAGQYDVTGVPANLIYTPVGGAGGRPTVFIAPIRRRRR